MNGGACGLIRQSARNLTNVANISFGKSDFTKRNDGGWYCMAVVSSCRKV